MWRSSPDEPPSQRKRRRFLRFEGWFRMAAVQSLRCKECHTSYELEARYVCEHCFGPLEVAYDYSGLDPAAAKRRIQAGPSTLWRYADFLPFAAPPPPTPAAGATHPLRPAP